MAKKERRPTTAEKVEVLCRIYRAAVKSGDSELRATTARELADYGVNVAAFGPIDVANATPPLLEARVSNER